MASPAQAPEKCAPVSKLRVPLGVQILGKVPICFISQKHITLYPCAIVLCVECGPIKEQGHHVIVRKVFLLACGVCTMPAVTKGRGHDTAHDPIVARIPPEHPSSQINPWERYCIISERFKFIKRQWRAKNHCRTGGCTAFRCSSSSEAAAVRA